MSLNQLPNYLRMHRKRAALSQEDVAFLIGVGNGSQICRYERDALVPNVEAALGLSIILGKSVEELFAGLYARIKSEVIARSKLVAVRERCTTRRHHVLRTLSAKRAN